MNLLKRLLIWIKKVFSRGAQNAQTYKHTTESELPIIFHEIFFVEKPPSNEEILSNQFYCSVSDRNYMWALFKCPCGCGEVITLSLQSVHNPHWKLTISDAGRPTLFPSIWRNQGCLSHFWLSDGCISWCVDSENQSNLLEYY